MKTSLLLAATVVMALHGVAVADEALAREKQCMGCHAIKEDGAGPAFQKIALYWKTRPDAEAKMVATILKGSKKAGGPHWNKATMPDQSERPLVSEAEAKRLATWIRAQ